MKVALLVDHLDKGGLPNYVLALARLLDEADCKVVVAHGNAPLPPHLEIDGVATLHLPGLLVDADALAADRAAAALLAWAPDVVHVHLCSSVALIDRLLHSGVPLVRSFHDLTSLCLRRGRRRWPGDRCQRPLEWNCAAWGCMISPPRNGGRLPHIANLGAKLSELDRYRAFGASIACSNFMARTLRLNGFNDSRIHIVPNFSRFDSDAVAGRPSWKRPGIPGRDRPLELLFAGQAVTGKGLEVLIAALARLQGNWRLTVLAEGPRLAASRKMTQRAGLSERIQFLGWVPQTRTQDYYKRSDLLVMPSIIDEALPLVGIEAMSFGTPLIGFAVGGIPDYLLDDETGVLVRTTTADGLRAGLLSVLSDPNRLPVWGRSARSLVARAHTKAVHLAALQNVYRDAGCVAQIPGIDSREKEHMLS